MRAVTLILAVSLLPPCASVQAQERPSVAGLARRGLLAPGARVRLYASQTADGRYGRFVGQIVSRVPDSLTLKPEDDLPVVVPVASITRLEVSRGRRSNWAEGAGIGLLVGAATGAIIGLASGDDPPCPRSGWFCSRWTAGTKAGALAVVFGGVGGVIGLIIGASTTTERWVEVPLDRLRVSFAPQRDGRFALGLSMRF